MARVPITEVIFKNSTPLGVRRELEVSVYKRGTSTLAKVWNSEFGGTEQTQPLKTNNAGQVKINGVTPWVEPGAYTLKGTGLELPYEAVSSEGSGGGGTGISKGEAEAIATEKAAAAQAASQPLDSDLTAIAALSTQNAGRQLLTKSSIAQLKEYLEIGTESPGGSGPTPFFDGSFQTGTKTAYELEQAPQPGGGTESAPPNVSSERCFIISEAPKETGLAKACRFKYVAGDPIVAGSQRSELQRPNPYEYPAEHIWTDEWIRVVEYDSGHYTLLRQFHEIEEPVGVAVGLYLEGTELKLHPGSGSSWWTHAYPGLNKWFHIKLHIYFHQTEGIIEVWYCKEGEALAKQVLANGKEVYTATNTLNGSNVGGATHIYDKVGVLRSNSAVGTTIIDHSGTKMFHSDPGELY